MVLNAAPSADVTIGLSSSNPGEGTVSPSSLTFTSTNWNVPQTVTVTGVDDQVDDGNVAYQIVTAAAVSIDSQYNGLNVDDVSVTNTDDDTAGTVQFDQAAFSIAKDGGSITIKVNRTGGAASGVTVDFATSDGTAHAGTDYTATAGTLTFGAGDTSQTFTIPILNNTIATGATTVNLTLSNPTGGASLGGSSVSLISSVSLVSVNSAGTNSGNSDSPWRFADSPSVLVSADGRYVVFSSSASDLVTSDTNGTGGSGSGGGVIVITYPINDNNGAVDVFERDLLLGTTSLVSVNSAGTGSGSGNSDDPRVQRRWTVRALRKLRWRSRPDPRRFQLL